MARLGPPGNDELLLVDDLELAPVWCSLAGLIRRIGSLGNQAFPAFVEGAPVQSPPISGRHLAQPEDSIAACDRARKYALERGAPLDKRAAAQIRTAVLQHVKDDECGRGAAACREVDATLQLLEAGWCACTIERDNLAVKDQTASWCLT